MKNLIYTLVLFILFAMNVFFWIGIIVSIIEMKVDKWIGLPICFGLLLLFYVANAELGRTWPHNIDTFFKKAKHPWHSTKLWS